MDNKFKVMRKVLPRRAEQGTCVVVRGEKVTWVMRIAKKPTRVSSSTFGNPTLVQLSGTLVYPPKRRGEHESIPVDAEVPLEVVSGENFEESKMDHLLRSMEQLHEGKKDRPGQHGPMIEYDWATVARAMGARLVGVSKARKSVVVSYGSKSYELTDNGGEINISVVAPVGDSVPFWSNAHPGGSVGPLTLAYRLMAEIDGRSIDYDKDLD
ncbi:MAG: hypothetical protein WC683_01925 [bacterium]